MRPPHSSRWGRVKRWPAIITAWLLAVAVLTTLPLPNDPPARATQVTGEADVADDWLFADLYISGKSYDQGWLRQGAGYFNDGGEPDCALATGRSPSSHTDTQVPAGTYIEETNSADRSSMRHRIRADKGGGSDDMTVDYTYWSHAARDDESQYDWICRHTTVTTDANGYFEVNFPRSLSGTPVMVTWSGSESLTVFRPNGNVVISAETSASGFVGRAYDGYTGGGQVAAWAVNRTFEIDYWADTRAHPDTTNPNGTPYEHVAGVATVTTDGNGHATINHADLNSGQAKSGQVTAGVTTSDVDNVPGGVILSGITPTQSTVHVRNENGAAVANTQINLHYVISGYNGGGVRPSWGTYGFTQIAGQDGLQCDGSDNDHACFRVEESTVSGALQYGLMTDFINEPNVDGVTWVSIASSAEGAWNNADLSTPSWARDTTPDGDDKAWIDFLLIDPDACAEANLTRTSIADDGWNQIVSADVNLNNWHDWTIDNDPEDGKCNAEGTLTHELGHVLGFEHASSGSSIMSTGAGGLFGTVPLNAPDVADARAIYGYSGSAYAPGGPKLSNLALALPGQTVGLVTIKEVTSEVKAGRAGNPWTKVHVQSPDRWAGAGIPSTAWVRGGTYDHPQHGSVGQPLPDGLTAGSRWYVRVNNATGEIIKLHPVQADQLVLDAELAEHETDDIGDGGAKDRVSITRLKAKAKALTR